jgi:glycosyltransferase involved in cell wall biosynthesis
LQDFDLMHLFNLQRPAEIGPIMELAGEAGLPALLSTIFWYDFDRDFAGSERWHGVLSILGARLTRLLFRARRRIRDAASALWRAQREMLKRADLLLPNSFAEIDLLIDHFRVGDGLVHKCEVVRNGIDANLFRDVPGELSPIIRDLGICEYVLQVGRIEDTKNQLGLVEALFDVDIPLVFVGQLSPYEPDYVQRCQQRGAERGQTYFIGNLPHEQLPAIYGAAAVHVLPTWRETPGLASLEAAAMGCRIVSTSVGSALEYFGDGAWYCHPADRSSIKRAVLSALSSPSPAELREHVLKNYTWEAAAFTTLMAYRRILA